MPRENGKKIDPLESFQEGNRIPMAELPKPEQIRSFYDYLKLLGIDSVEAFLKDKFEWVRTNVARVLASSTKPNIIDLPQKPESPNKPAKKAA